MQEHVIYKNQKKLRCGYTTGSCAAAAAKAAAQMLLFGEEVKEVKLLTPAGIPLYLEIRDCLRGEGEVSCAVKKDAGDDPDVTDGLLIFASVKKSREQGIEIDGGTGVGRVTKRGLSQKIGEAAINKVPKEMIRKELLELIRRSGYEGGLAVCISVPQGEETAQHTFNPRLGIEGGISILGTSGIVEPMSEKALTDTIYLEMKMLHENGLPYCYAVPGNYGIDFIGNDLHGDAKKAVKCSNYIGETIDAAIGLQMKGILLVGNIGKFVKLAGGIMNTHSRVADGRMEILAAHAGMNGASSQMVKQIMESLTTQEALSVLAKNRMLFHCVMESLIKKAADHVAQRTKGKLWTEIVIYADEYGILTATERSRELMTIIENLPAVPEGAEPKTSPSCEASNE